VQGVRTVTSVVIVFVVNDEDLDGWPVQPFKTKGKDGNWKNYITVSNRMAAGSP
jgi:hypothetical protein